MNSLSSRVGLLLLVVFMLLVMLLVFAAQVESLRVRLMTLEAITAIVGLTLAGVWCALQPLLRRIGRLADAVASCGGDAANAPLSIAGADAGGDEVARLAAHAERLTGQLAEQSTALARAARQRTELLANVSHDLRTPLASMHGYLELLLLRQDSLAPAEAHNYLQTATRQSERLSNLVGDLFELTRLDADDMRPQAEPFAPAELAQDVVQKYAADARRREVKLETRCNGTPGPAGTPYVLADIGLIERVLDNLVDNALRHTPAGGAVSISIDRRGRQVCLAVHDTGVGIAAGDLPGIFERYERAARVGEASSGDHAGLGLAIARRIVNLHGSSLRVQSEPGLGTRVHFELTQVDPGRATAPAAPVSAAAPDATQQRQHSA